MRAPWSTLRRAALAVLVVALGACGGDDDDAPAVSTPPGGAPRAAPPKAAGAGSAMPGVTRIEDKVACPTPTDAKQCDPVAPLCGANEYCLAAGSAHYCGPCPERDAIRHVFKPRDFQGADLRDPFLSYVITQTGMLGPTEGDEDLQKTLKCTRREQMVATNYSYQSLKLVGIVSQGTQRKVLMMDSGNLGHIIKEGDCVGKEQAFVKDIGAGYVTFTIDRRDPNAPGDREPEEQAVQLYPTQVSVNTQIEDPAGRAPAVPMVAPPTQGGTTQPQGGTSVRIEQPPPPQPRLVAPPPAPTQINP